MGQRILLGLFVLLCLFAFSSVISTGVHNLRTEEITENEVVETGSGETSAEVVLGSALYQDKLSEIESITSSISETPAASSYESSTQTLTVSGLTESTSRTLTIVYNSELDDEYMQIFGPFLLSFIFLGIIGLTIYSILRKGRR